MNEQKYVYIMRGVEVNEHRIVKGRKGKLINFSELR